MARRIRRGKNFFQIIFLRGSSTLDSSKNLQKFFQTAEADEIKEMKEKLENIVKPIIGKMYENEDAGGDAEDEDEEHDEL